MTQHLNEEQFARYHSRKLSPAELLRVDDHIAQCSECRERLYRQERAGTQLRALKADLTSHLAYEQVAACAHGSIPPEVAQHLEECDLCRAEVDDLQRFRAEIQPPRRIPWRLPAAAAVLLAAGLAFWPARQPAVAPPGPAPVAETLSPEDAAAVQMALATKKLERAPVLDRLITRRGTLLGPDTAETFEIREPMGTTVLEDRPTFRWTPAAGAKKYVVAIFDERLEKVLESPAIEGSVWRPETPMPRGRIFNWQVNTTVNGRQIHAPTPPAPEARFLIVTQEVAGRIEAARREHPGNHLLLAVLYAKAGARLEAGRELDALEVTDHPTADALRGSLK